MRGDRQKVIAEEFIHFEFEITLLTVRQRKGPTLFCPPIGHVLGLHALGLPAVLVVTALLHVANGRAKQGLPVALAHGEQGDFKLEVESAATTNTAGSPRT